LDCSARVPLAWLVFLSPTEIRAVIVHPGRHVEQAGARAVGRRIPIGPALYARPYFGTLRAGDCARNTDRAAAVVEALRPGLLHEGLALQELAARPVQHVKEPVAISPQHY